MTVLGEQDKYTQSHPPIVIFNLKLVGEKLKFILMEK